MSEYDPVSNPAKYTAADFAPQQAAITVAESLLIEVYRQCGNHAPAKRRHALTPGLRDSIRDYFGDRLASLLKSEGI